jgi:hypothetical protein
MIVELVFGVVVNFIVWVIDRLPSGSVPDWLGEGGYLTTVWTSAAGLGAWVPWTLFTSVAVFVMGAAALSFLIKLGRIILSLFTAGGGSAA